MHMVHSVMKTAAFLNYTVLILPAAQLPPPSAPGAMPVEALCHEEGDSAAH